MASPPFSLFWSFFVVSFWSCHICICFLFSTFSCLYFSFFLSCLILYLSSLSLPFLVCVLSKMSQKKLFFSSCRCRICFCFLILWFLVSDSADRNQGDLFFSYLLSFLDLSYLLRARMNSFFLDPSVSCLVSIWFHGEQKVCNANKRLVHFFQYYEWKIVYSASQRKSRYGWI